MVGQEFVFVLCELGPHLEERVTILGHFHFCGPLSMFMNEMDLGGFR